MGKEEGTGERDIMATISYWTHRVYGWMMDE